MSFSIVIPSRNIDNLQKCVAAIRKAGETARVVVIDDGLVCSRVLDLVGPILFAVGRKPFSFAANINMGIRAAGRDDVLLLNDDALLETPGGFTDMSIIRAQPDGYGILAASTNVTGYPLQQRRPCPHQRVVRELPVVAFVAVLILRRTIDAVGLLDERFVTYGGEDVDYCLRVREAGLKVGVSDFCFVDHSKLPSTFRAVHPRNGAPGDITESNRLGREKWGNEWPHR
jgi:glycosyltransferase involved in cell wall biosynthesis